MSISVQNICKNYGSQKALDNVSFEVKSGEIVGFIGPNGAGKSTMMKIISGYIAQTSGKVLVNEFDVVEQSLEVRRNIGYLPENNPLYLDMYVKEYLQFVAGIYKLDCVKDRIMQIVNKTGLGLEQRKKIGALSKGYRQRVGLAQALIHNPKVLILDEPTSGLDPNQIVEIRNLISEIGKEKTVILSTHIMQEVEAICHRVIIINKGIIVANDTSEDIYGHTSEKGQTILVELSENVDENLLEDIEGVTKALQVKENNWIIQGIQDIDIRTAIFNFAVKNNIVVLSMQKQEKSLEEVFQELTK
jgi:ABC-2 type transport system ATP-binding protein